MNSSPTPPPSSPSSLFRTLTIQDWGVLVVIGGILVSIPCGLYEKFLMPDLREAKASAEGKLAEATSEMMTVKAERDQLKTEIAALRQSPISPNTTPNPIQTLVTSVPSTSQFDRYNLYYNGPNDFVGLNLFISKEYKEKLNNPQEVEVHVLFSEGTNNLNFCIYDENNRKSCTVLRRNEGSAIEESDQRRRGFRLLLSSSFPEINPFRMTHLTFDISENFQYGAGGFAVSHVDFY